MVGYESLCIPLGENKMVDVEDPYFKLLSVTPLEQMRCGQMGQSPGHS